MVIIGAGMAGTRAAIALRGADYSGPITLISDETYLPYDRPPLSKSAITSEEDPAPTLLLDDGQLSSLKVNLIRNAKATKLNPPEQTIELISGTIVHYEKLLLATGAKPRKLSVPGGDFALTLRDFGDAENLRRQFAENQKVVIIGGGFIGLELAASARKRGCGVTVVEAQPRILMRGVPQAIATVVHDRHVEGGVKIITGVALTKLDEYAVYLADGRRIAADLIVAGIGASPEVTLASEAGLTIANGVVCDEYLRTSDPHIYGAGDCCNFPDVTFGLRRTRLEAWRSASDQANTAVANMLGGAVAHKSVAWMWSDQFELSLQITGATDLGSKTVTRHLSTNACIIFHLTDEGRLVGASGIGPGNAVARDIRLTELLVSKNISPSSMQLEDPNTSLKSLLKI